MNGWKVCVGVSWDIVVDCDGIIIRNYIFD